jgi:hypothetical protein
VCCILQRITSVLHAESYDLSSGALRAGIEPCRLLATVSPSLLHFLGTRFPNTGCVSFVLERCINCHEHQVPRHDRRPLRTSHADNPRAALETRGMQRTT